MRVTPFALALALVFVSAIALVTGYAAFTAASSPTPPAVDWIYGPKRVLTTGQKGVVVYCQGKTNSRAFADRERAVPGDVVIETCRAVRGGESS